ARLEALPISVDCSVVRMQRPSRPPLFPYATLFRSPGSHGQRFGYGGRPGDGVGPWRRGEASGAWGISPRLCARPAPGFRGVGKRSEEHTSELQSRENLVCRLLLEKKNF